MMAVLGGSKSYKKRTPGANSLGVLLKAVL